MRRRKRNRRKNRMLELPKANKRVSPGLREKKSPMMTRTSNSRLTQKRAVMSSTVMRRTPTMVSLPVSPRVQPKTAAKRQVVCRFPIRIPTSNSHI